MAVSNLLSTRLGTRLRYHRKLVVAVSSLLATRFGNTTIFHRQLVAVSNLPATRFVGTITLASQACCCQQLTNDEIAGHDDDYVSIANFLLDQLTSDEA